MRLTPQTDKRLGAITPIGRLYRHVAAANELRSAGTAKLNLPEKLKIPFSK
jgi:hypothetical protein